MLYRCIDIVCAHFPVCLDLVDEVLNSVLLVEELGIFIMLFYNRVPEASSLASCSRWIPTGLHPLYVPTLCIMFMNHD